MRTRLLLQPLQGALPLPPEAQRGRKCQEPGSEGKTDERHPEGQRHREGEKWKERGRGRDRGGRPASGAPGRGVESERLDKRIKALEVKGRELLERPGVRGEEEEGQRCGKLRD